MTLTVMVSMHRSQLKYPLLSLQQCDCVRDGKADKI